MLLLVYLQQHMLVNQHVVLEVYRHTQHKIPPNTTYHWCVVYVVAFRPSQFSHVADKELQHSFQLTGYNQEKNDSNTFILLFHHILFNDLLFLCSITSSLTLSFLFHADILIINETRRLYSLKCDPKSFSTHLDNFLVCTYIIKTCLIINNITLFQFEMICKYENNKIRMVPWSKTNKNIDEAYFHNT